MVLACCSVPDPGPLPVYSPQLESKERRATLEALAERTGWISRVQLKLAAELDPDYLLRSTALYRLPRGRAEDIDFLVGIARTEPTEIVLTQAVMQLGFVQAPEAARALLSLWGEEHDRRQYVLNAAVENALASKGTEVVHLVAPYLRHHLGELRASALGVLLRLLDDPTAERLVDQTRSDTHKRVQTTIEVLWDMREVTRPHRRKRVAP